ncbi:MAG: cobalt ECF transporter T component CbiQ [Omnitrophica bacterium]|nr:cobalt ECF transporter T component CbiQ [Candidatus Omnitrophota bacterium]
MLNEVFSDRFAHKDNFLTRIDARTKMIFVFVAIITILFSRTPYLPVIIAFLSLVFLISIRVPAKTILLRMLAPLTIAIVILLIQIFFYGTTPIFKLTVFGFHFAGYKEGLFRGLVIAGKVTGCVSLIIFLSMTTPVSTLLRAASWFRISKTWIEIAAITYRYVFVLIEDAITIRDAQKVRLGYSNLSRSVRSLAELTGSVFIRAYDQSISTYEAMQLRGYSGTSKVSFEKEFKLKDGLHLIIFSITLSLLIALNLYWR